MEGDNEVKGFRAKLAAKSGAAPALVHDSWIGECEASGVYSRRPPVYRYDLGEPVQQVELTRAEIRNLAQRHLNTFFRETEFVTWTGECDRRLDERAMQHEARFWRLYSILPVEDQRRFDLQIEIRQRYLQSIEGEVHRCREVEMAFRAREDAGLVSEEERQAYKTPGFILGYFSGPSPADGGAEPEHWDVFASDDTDESGDVANKAPAGPDGTQRQCARLLHPR